MRIHDATIDRWIAEDVPYFDLTTHLLGIAGEPGRIFFAARETTVACGSGEVSRIFDRFGIRTGSAVPDGERISAGQLLVEGFGNAEALHSAWKVSVNVLEYACGVAGRTKALCDAARRGNPMVEVVSTRKGFPGTKELALKAVLAGGGLPHRLGLSETILVFDHHRTFLGRPLPELMGELRRRSCEKKIIVEAVTLEEAAELAAAGADGIQFDKVEPDRLSRFVVELRRERPGLLILAAGGINIQNAEAYAATGVDALATSAMYFGKPADIRASMEKTGGPGNGK